MKSASKKRRMKRIRRYFSNPLLLVAIVVLCLFIAEALTRVLVTEEVSSVVRLEWNSNAVLDRPIRKKAGRPILYHEPFSMRFNTTKPPGTFRIIFLGDSMTYGPTAGQFEEPSVVGFTTLLEGSSTLDYSHGTSHGPTGWGAIVEEDLFTTPLEASLNKLPGDEDMPVRRYEVLNFGGERYNINQIKEMFYEALAFEPDLVIYNYYVDDLDTVSLFRSHGLLRLHDGLIPGQDWLLGYKQSVPYLFPFPGNGKLLLYSRAYRFLNTKMCAVIRKRDPRFTLRFFDIGRERAELSLDMMIAVARRDKIPFVIMLSPIFNSSEIAGSYEPRNFIMDNCHSGLSVWDVSRELAPYYNSEELGLRFGVSEDERHSPVMWGEDDSVGSAMYGAIQPNGRGHIAIAEALQLYLERYVLNRSSLEHLVPADEKEKPCIVV